VRGALFFIKLDEIKSLRKLLDYNREDEEKNYDECEIYQKRNHVVHAIRKLDKLVNRLEGQLGPAQH
jgi:hypothetical protein